MTARRFALLMTALLVSIGFSFVFASCAARADAQTAPDIYHRDFGATTCYYATNSQTGEVAALSCVRDR
jgi:hypothetical protein